MNPTAQQLIDFLDANQVGVWLDSLRDDDLRAIEWRLDHATALAGRIRFNRMASRNRELCNAVEVPCV